ncbi:hypothetical protein AMATHDRAFT_60342 [Amanita thiersii Skay4041]|uniref:non-specific serine/threonine protein kinase n=1 Tax=Amanita thiersii Skay4041 TaxID=703135 RepID=A0A2A9NRA6_9AGAR|nr:hypothetical protein AMATHDRAFT_60342 [Amanita thiersii Skay4041]
MFASLVIALARKLFPYPSVHKPLEPSEAWIIPTSPQPSSSSSLIMKRTPFFPCARRILINLKNVGESSASDTLDCPTPSATSSLTLSESLLQSPRSRPRSANWVNVSDSLCTESTLEADILSLETLSLSPTKPPKEVLDVSSAVIPDYERTESGGSMPFGSYTCVGFLGEGGYGTGLAVREKRCQESHNKEPKRRLMCFKVFVKAEVLENNQLLGVQRELLAYKVLASVDGMVRSAFLMELDGVLEDVHRLYFGMELMKCDLLTLMSRGETQIRDNRKRWIAQIAVGLDALHAVGIVHRDIKPENLLIDYQDNIRIADFGSAYVSPERSRLDTAGEYSVELLGTWPYIAPEVVDNKGKSRREKRRKHGPAVDYWALGCIVFELESPGFLELFETELDLDLYRRWHTFDCSANFIANSRFPSDVEDLVLGLVHLDPSLRYTIEDLRWHPYFEREDGTTEFDNIEIRALKRARTCLEDEENRDVCDGHPPLVFYPVMNPPTGPFDAFTFDNLCWINPRGRWAS